jgi:enediyne biosynthesis protein E4
VRVFTNRGNRNHWIGFALEGKASNRDAVGAVVHLYVADSPTPQVRARFVTGWSAAREPIRFGLGGRTRFEKAVIRWPSGKVQTLTNLAIDTVQRVVEP